MNFLQEAARVNNEGALLLSSGDQRTTLKYFRTGLQYLQQGCEQITQQRTKQEDTSLRTLLSLRRALPVPLVNEPPIVNRLIQRRYIYRSAFVFQAEGELTLEKQTLASAVLMFNYALGLHQGADNSDECTLDRALYLYNQSSQLLYHIYHLVDCHEMVAAILSSKADIYYRLNDFQSVRAVLDKLFLMAHNLEIENEIAKKTSKEDTIAPSA